jgi:ABC-type microcin C transport system permease subunit YejE
MTATPKALRTRNMTAAKKAAALIRDAILLHISILEEGKVPESSFTASIAKYETALTTLRVLDVLGEAAPEGKGWLATVEVSKNDLDLLLHLLRQSDMAGVIAQAEDSSPIGHLLAAVADGQEERHGA